MEKQRGHKCSFVCKYNRPRFCTLKTSLCKLSDKILKYVNFSTEGYQWYFTTFHHGIIGIQAVREIGYPSMKISYTRGVTLLLVIPSYVRNLDFILFKVRTHTVKEQYTTSVV